MTRLCPTISSTLIRSLRMTSGLFNTGGSGDLAEITAFPKPVKAHDGIGMDDGLLGDFLEQPTLDQKTIRDIFGLPDPLGDDTMDSFVDLSSFMGSGGESFIEKEEPAGFTCLVDEVKVDRKARKRPYSMLQMEEAATVEPVVEEPTCHDHAYVVKRSRKHGKMELQEESSVEIVEESAFFTNPESPIPSTSHTAKPEDKYRNRREKNNIASKRSREVRKKKFVDMEKEAERLETENAILEKRIVELEKLAKQMKEILVAKMAGNNSSK